MLDRVNQQQKRRTHMGRIFPSEACCLGLVRASTIEIHEEWIEAVRHLKMQILAEHKRLVRYKSLAVHN